MKNLDTIYVIHSKKDQGRRSKESLKISNVGEIAVLNYEKEKLIIANPVDLADKVAHESEEGNTPEWDNISFDENGEKIFIEVKSSTGKTITSVDITDNEWQAELKPKYRENNLLYLVTEALATTNSPMEILRNP